MHGVHAAELDVGGPRVGQVAFGSVEKVVVYIHAENGAREARQARGQEAAASTDFENFIAGAPTMPAT